MDLPCPKTLPLAKLFDSLVPDLVHGVHLVLQDELLVDLVLG
jgi:hypothetical protein